jgi:hypothetical protein
MNEDSRGLEAAMNADGLYREDIFTDRQVGTIRRLTPVTRNGDDDADREVAWVGQTQVLTPAGAMPLSFEIAAKSLEEAVAGFPDAARVAVEDTMRQLEELRREAASSIIVPEGGAGPVGGGPGGPGGLPGGGGIHMP